MIYAWTYTWEGWDVYKTAESEAEGDLHLEKPIYGTHVGPWWFNIAGESEQA